jgi:hypothetical protein
MPRDRRRWIAAVKLALVRMPSVRAITWVKQRGAEFAEVDLAAVRPARQRYTFLRRAGQDGAFSVIRYQSGTFTADVTFDADGIVTDYPGLGRLA